MVAILVIGVLLFALILWRNYEMSVATSAGPPPAIDLGGTPVYTPKAVPTAEAIALQSIPVIGPLAAYTTNALGNDIIQNKFLEAHSVVGPNPGQTEASAGIAGVTVPISSKPIYNVPVGAEATVIATGGLSLLSSTNRSKVESDLEFWKW
jgi:hypothetical protein